MKAIQGKERLSKYPVVFSAWTRAYWRGNKTNIKKKVMELEEEENINKAVEPCYPVD